VGRGKGSAIGLARCVSVVALGLGLALAFGDQAGPSPEQGEGSGSTSHHAPRGSRVPPADPATRRPNILVVMWDTVRRDSLSVYGYEKPTTPTLDAFARQARVYEHAITPSPWTFPAHVALFTGLYPRTAAPTSSPPSRNVATLAELLSSAGYDTYMFSANPWVSPELTLDRGFRTAQFSWREPIKSEIRQALETRLAGDPSREAALRRVDSVVPRGLLNDHVKEAGAVVDRAFVRWLSAREGAAPFFAFLNFMEAHEPRFPTESERQRFLPADRVGLSYAQARQGKPVVGDLLTAFRGEYAAAIYRLDQLFGEIVTELERRRLIDDTVVIVVSDHGENLGERGLFGHATSIWRTLVDVPLLVRYPPRFPPGRVARPVVTVDLFPTILELAGVPLPQGAGYHGYSLCDEERSHPASRWLVSERISTSGPVARDLPLRSIESDGFRLIRQRGTVQALFDVSADPDETNNLLAGQPERSASLGRTLDRWLDATPEGKRAATAPLLDAPTLDRMRALGYDVTAP